MPQEPHEPSEKTRAQAEQAAGLGLPHEQIGALIGISDKTLRKYYATELAVGKAKASAKIAQTLFNKAIKGDTTAGTTGAVVKPYHKGRTAVHEIGLDDGITW